MSSEERKEQIVNAALKRFGHFGYSKTTMNELADDLQITKANLYYYYPDKMALFVDVIWEIASELFVEESKIVAEYKGGFLKTLFSLLENRAGWMKKYYVLHINESLEWVKSETVQAVMEKAYARYVKLIQELFERAIENKELVVKDAKATALSYTEMIHGLGIIHNIKDIICKIPDPGKMDEILKSQKAATQIIFEGKLIRK